jgi:subtilase family serine protease
MITHRIDASKVVALAGNTRPEASAQNDRGRVAENYPMDHMLLQLKRPPDLEQALEAFIDELSTPGSPNYHKWLTAEVFGQRFGPAQADLDTITGWLQSSGLAVNVVYPSGMVIDFSGTAGQVRKAFGTEIHHLQVNGAQHIANMSDPKIPAALAPAVVGIVSLHDFMPRPMYKPRAEYTFASGSYTYYAVTPGDLATIYNLNPLFSEGHSGQGQTIVVIEDTNVYTTADWTTFRNTFGLSSYTSGSFTQVHPAPPSGHNNCKDPNVNADDGEAILDAEYASAAAPSAAIELASCRNTVTTFGGLIALQNLINGSSPPAIVSISYGECEAFNGAAANAAYSSAYQQAVTESVSVFVSSGDEGAASCDANQPYATHGIGVSGFASTPYNVAVGGTDFGDTYAHTTGAYWNSTNTPTYASAKSYIPEIPWNDSCASMLIANYEGYATTYGLSGFCNSTAGANFLTTASGSGGPSGCATGVPATSGVVSGTCAGYAKPSWQSVFGNPSDGVRDLPDVSLFAANGVWGHYYPYCYTDIPNGGASCAGAPSTWAGAGGTSFSSPILAGIQALVNQVWGPQGNPNPVYYRIAASEYGSGGNSACNSSSLPPLRRGLASTCVFYDVTQGDLDVNCLANGGTLYNCYLPSGTNGVLSLSNGSYLPAYGTAVGWDFSTGIGTVNAYNLVHNVNW